jgi:hypothetical protein
MGNTQFVIYILETNFSGYDDIETVPANLIRF